MNGRRVLLTVGLAAAGALGAAAAASAAPAPVAPAARVAPVTRVIGHDRAGGSAATLQQAEVGGFITNADLPHLASSKPGPAVSVHGWWEKTPIKPTRATKAKVRVWLQAKPGTGGSWRNVGFGQGTYGPGPGGGKRATARVICKQGPISKPYAFRALVDVDLIGYADSPEMAYGKTANVWCLP